MKKRWAALALTVSMLCALALPAQAKEKSYPDIQGHYAAGVIKTWSDYGVLEGYRDGTFRPDGHITRAEMATVVDRVMGYQNTVKNTFTDVPAKQWYAEHILHLAAEGILKGNPDGTMKPDEPITRQEAFATLARVLDLQESDKATGFKDDATIASWAKGYVAAMKEAGYIQGDQKGNIRANEPITRAEVVTILNKMAAAFVNKDGTYSKDCKGNLIVNAQDVTLKDMTISGDLIVADGVAEGDVYLDKVTVKGDVILRGCGENSFHIKPGCNVTNVIVTKTTGGRIRLVNESGETIPMVYIDDGVGGVTLEGGMLNNVVVACDAQVAIATSVKTLSVAGNAKVTVEKNATVARAELGNTAKGAALTVKGKVTTLVNDAGAAVDNKGTIGSGSSGSSSSSGSSGGGGSSSTGGSGSGSGSGNPPSVISKVTLQLLAPKFGEKPDPADVMGVGYTARTEWKNADGSPASYRWKENSGDADTFTANQAYQAVITLTPNSGYSFIDKLQVEVTDGKTTPTTYTPAEVAVSGKDRVVKMVYDKTENKDPVSAVNVVSPAAVDVGATAELKVSYWNNLLVDPATFTYQWYQCGDASGGGKTLIAGAVGKDYTVPAGDTQNAGELYFCCEVIVQGKAYPSGVKTVEVRNAIDPNTLPIPVIGSDLMVMDNGRIASVEIGNLMRHKDVSYNVSVDAEVKSVGGGVLGNGVGIATFFDYKGISDDGTVSLQLDMAGLVSGFVPLENDMAFSSDLELGEVRILVEPEIRNIVVPNKNQEKIIDLTGTGNGKFYIYTYETPDDLWKGPTRDLQFVVHDKGWCGEGVFVDKNNPDDPNTPDDDVVPSWRYSFVDVIFGQKNSWLRGYNDSFWDETVDIPANWLDGFETGESKSEVRCAFYESNYPDSGMNIYYIKIRGQDIVFDSDNS